MLPPCQIAGTPVCALIQSKKAYSKDMPAYGKCASQHATCVIECGCWTLVLNELSQIAETILCVHKKTYKFRSLMTLYLYGRPSPATGKRGFIVCVEAKWLNSKRLFHSHSAKSRFHGQLFFSPSSLTSTMLQQLSHTSCKSDGSLRRTVEPISSISSYANTCCKPYPSR